MGVSRRTASSAAAAAIAISPSIIDPAAPSSRPAARSQARPRCSRHLRALVRQFGGVVRACLLEPQEGQVPLRVRPQLLVTQRNRVGERMVEIVLGSRDVARGGFQPPGQQQGRHAIACSDVTLGGFECGADAVRPGDPVAQHDPRPAEAVGDPDSEQRVVAGAPG